MFAVAVGAAPVRNTFEPLCETTGGAIEEAFPGEGMAAKVVRHVRRLGSPRWSVAGVDWDAPPRWQVLPDGGHAGDTLRISAGLSHRPAAAPRVRLRDADGREANLLPALAEIPGDLLPRMAGRDRWAVESSAPGRLALAMRHGLLTPETGCIVISERDASERTDGSPLIVSVPQALPAGWGAAGKVCAAAAFSAPFAGAGSVATDYYSLPEFIDVREDSGANEADDNDVVGPPRREDVSAWVGFARARLTLDPAFCAQLRTGLATEEYMLELLPIDWHAAVYAVARKRGLSPQGLVVAVIFELLRQEIAGGEQSPLDADAQTTLVSAAAWWQVPVAVLDELIGRLGLAVTTALIRPPSSVQETAQRKS